MNFNTLWHRIDRRRRAPHNKKTSETNLTEGLSQAPSQLDPSVIVERIAAGDAHAEAELVRRYSRAMMTMLEHRTGDVQRAEDVHQDTFCIVLERLRSTGIDEPARIAAFIHRTALNVLIGDYRKESRRRTSADTELVQRQLDESSDQLGELIKRESSHAIRETLLELNNERDKELLYRFYILQEEKLTICKILALSAEHFDRVISRARKRFRQLVEKRKLAVVDSGGDYLG
jgi:RNA polymerase sigma-70 factor (ECF subfamily)